MTTRSAAPVWAWAVTGLAFASGAALVGLVLSNPEAMPPHLDEQVPIYIGTALIVPIFGALGAVILRHHPRHPIGWILVAAVAAVIVDTAARWYVIDGLYLREGGLPGTAWVAWFVDWNWFPSMLTLVIFIPLLFPDGRPPSPRWRWVVVATAVWLALASIGYSLAPHEYIDFPEVTPPVGYGWAYPIGGLMLLTPVAVGVALAAVIVRRRRARGDEREQLRWMLWAAALSLVGWAITFILGSLDIGFGFLTALFTWIPLVLIPVAVTIAIVKYRLYDIDVVINRTLVYGGLTLLVVAAYGLVVVAVTSLTPLDVDWRGSVLVVVAVAIAAYPVREWLQRLVNRLMYGDRDDPARAMSRLAQRVSETLTPAALLPAVAESVGEALKVPYVAVYVAGSTTPTAMHGARTSEPESFDLVHQGEPVGTLEVGRRGPSDQFSAADVRLLQDVARQVAGTVRAVQLAADLQASRERLVLAREEERRRVRRDLHDGVGSSLAALALQAGNVRRALPESPESAAGLATRLEDGIRETVIDIRRIVDDLRPPALDDLGLAGALRERADALMPGAVTLDVRMGEVALPAAVDVAAYRIATEAMTNAARHSGARTITVRLDAVTAPQTVLLTVTDDGRGISGDAQPGVGMSSMRERAVELGGECVIERAPGAGTRVRAVIPVPATAEPPRDDAEDAP
ncbi:GAF domain-containing sensor histidine kinase [Microbacter sp. GSS18]|nr:GAF domain-containing sensor histidine kinase [Microbacter sp. GSS18]